MDYFKGIVICFFVFLLYIIVCLYTYSPKSIKSSSYDGEISCIDDIRGKTVTYKQFKNVYYENHSKKIPEIIFRTSPFPFNELPDTIKYYLDELVLNNPTYVQVYFDDTDCYEFIKEYYPEFLEDYDSLIPTAFKADLWRLMVLYKYGGIYNDIGHIYKRKISEVVSPDDELVLCIDYDKNYEYNSIHNAFIACHPQNQIIYQILLYTIDNVRNRVYGSDSLDITGPTAIGRCLKKMNIALRPGIIYHNNQKIVLVKFHVYNKENTFNSIININKEPSIQTKFPYYYDIMYKNRNVQHYGDLWHQGKVYKEKEKIIYI